MTTKLFFLSVLSLLFGYSEKDVDELHNELYSLLDTDLERALVVSDSTLALAEKISYDWGVANTYYIKAFIYDEMNELDEALLFYLKADKILEKSQEDKFLKTRLDVILNIGTILRKNNNYDDAIEFYQEALAWADEEKHTKVKLQLLFNLSFALQDQGNFPSAVNYLEKTARLATKVGNDRILLKAWNVLGIVNFENEDYDKARQFYDKIMVHPSASQATIAKVKHNKANTYGRVGSMEEAKKLYEEALMIKREIEDTPSSMFITLRDLASLNSEIGDLEQAQILAGEAESVYEDVFHNPESFELFHIMHAIANEMGDYQKANFYANRYAEEVTNYYEQQKTIIELKDQFKTDLILAGFQQELEAKVRADILWKWIYAISFVAISVISIMYIRRVMMRRVVEQAIAQLKP